MRIFYFLFFTLLLGLLSSSTVLPAATLLQSPATSGIYLLFF